MATSRSRGLMSFTTSPPVSIVPASASSSPAIVRGSVLLPQPERPTSTANSPSRMSRSTPRTAGTAPKLLCNPLIFTTAMAGHSPFRSVPSAAHRPKRQAAHQMPLHQYAEQDGGHQRDDGKRARL